VAMGWRQWGQIFTCESRSCPPFSKNFHSYRRALKSKDSTPIIARRLFANALGEPNIIKCGGVNNHPW